jgi:pimeloyl-ACP methyl ester carboxylesterase
VGWSLGGHVAYGIAKDAPDMVSSITTIGSPPINFNTAGLEIGFNDIFNKVLVPSWIHDPKRPTDAEALGFAKILGFTKPEEQASFARDYMGADPLFRKHLMLDVDSYKNAVVQGEDIIASTQLPVFLMQGEHDDKFGLRLECISAWQGKLNPPSSVCTIKEGTHIPFKSHPQEFFQAFSLFQNQAEAERQEAIKKHGKARESHSQPILRLSLNGPAEFPKTAISPLPSVGAGTSIGP